MRRHSWFKSSSLPKIFYDFHIHSCLSPCADDDMTPANIIGMAKLKELKAIAITDHNSCKHCSVAMELGQEAGIIVMPGMELTTVEEVHVLCFFQRLEDAQAFDEYVYQCLLKIPNNERIFGNQLMVSKDEEVIHREPYLLINATSISYQEVDSLVESFHGIMIPAHIDKSSNSVLSNLGFLPENSQFSSVEVKEMDKIHQLKLRNPYLNKCIIISNSDAHTLGDINEARNWIEVEELNLASVFERLADNL